MTRILTLGTLLTLFLVGCGYTRVEKDVYTITDVDTTELHQVHNQPGERDNGVIYPSSRTIVSERSTKQHDSIVEREYPDFIRLGVFEAIGLIGAQQSGNSTYTGLFGLYHQIDALFFDEDPSANPDTYDSLTLFSGYVYKFGFGEWKINLFGDDPNWTWGLTTLEIVKPDADPDNEMIGAGVLSVRKRFYFRNKIPYFAITPQVSVSAGPSPFLHTAVSADLGSIGGMNLRVYGGFYVGVTRWDNGNGVQFPYIGIGTSALDFLNREEELDVEWKYHEHSAWQISVADALFAGLTTAEMSFFAPDTTKVGSERPAITGFTLRLLNARLALPVLDHHFAIGTSVASLMILGADEYAVGVLPIRLSYFWLPFNAALAVEPFAEFSYLPSTYVNLGVRGAVSISDNFSIVLTGGYISGETGSATGQAASGESGHSNLEVGTNGLKFSGIYFGFGVSILDRLFGDNDLRYWKGYPHE